MAKAKSKLKVTLLKSVYGRKPGHAECVKGLGLRRRHQTVEVIPLHLWIGHSHPIGSPSVWS